MRNIQNHDVKIFTDNIETTVIEQIERLLTIPAFSGCKIHIMPDVYAGAGCVLYRLLGRQGYSQYRRGGYRLRHSCTAFYLDESDRLPRLE